MRKLILLILILLVLTSCSTRSTSQAEPLTSLITADGVTLDLQVISTLNADQVHLLRTLSIPGYQRGKTSQCNPAFSPDGTLLAAACGANAVPLWQVQSGTLLQSFDTHDQQMVACTFNLDGSILACGGFDGRVTLWDPTSGEVLQEIASIGTPVWDLAFSPDGKTLATCGIRDTLRLWDVSSGDQVWSADSVEGCLSLAFDPAGSVIAYGSLDGSVGVQQTSDGTSVEILSVLGEPVGDIAFNPAGTLLVAACDDNLIHTWSVGNPNRSGEYLKDANLAGHDDFVNGLAFSPRGGLLASASHDQSLRLWDSTSLQSLATLNEHTDAVLRAAFNPQGTLLATVSWDGTVMLFGVEK